MKKDGKITVRINKKLLEDAKKNIPNISTFVQECLEHYLGYANGTYPTANDREILDKIGKLQAELYMRNQNFNIHEHIRKAEEEKINRALRKLWNEYRKNMIIDEQSMTEALTILPVDAETLEDMLDFAYVNQEELGLNFTWSKLYELYENEEVE